MSPRSDDPPAKATLFCPSCDRRAHASGDWRTVRRGRRVRLRCPACGTDLAVHRCRGPTASDLWSRNVAAWTAAARAWRRLWRPTA
ncbi:hypothetical protein [Haloarcula litorea]|uniref:hypothetical protein n=1 Tax=Haloarcula litorea TaxID=3032579 RepID=UPI0023E8B35A|nr:hypothetical protein [Halomicroarcula sp. GDY20]